MFNIEIQLLHPNAQVPKKANPKDSCADVVAVRRESLTWKLFNLFTVTYGYKYHLGFALNLPSNTELQLRSRSSIFKTGMILSNGIGTGDEGYTGEYSVVFYHLLPFLRPYDVGDRIAQIKCVSSEDMLFKIVEELPNKDRGELGWGSSGVSSLLDRLYPESDTNIANISKKLGEADITGVDVYSFPSKEK